VPLGAREVLFIMRARDEASRTITNLGSVFGTVGTKSEQLGGKMVGVGSAMTAVGTGIGAIGLAGLGFFNSAVNAAADYDKSATLTLTQVDKQKASFQQLHDLGLDIAKKFPVAFEQIQPTLYDIFSSMDVGITGARKLIEGFAKASTAGNVDLQTAGRATIQIMNAFKIPVSDTNRVLDDQFQLVRKGVGTYGEFASTLGRAVPSAIRAGQSFETLAGMLAFLTRNGLSTAMASASAARALDAMSNPKVTDRLQAMGITVKDANGQFLPMVDVLGQMNNKFKDMTKPELANALQNLFKGAGGTIQARRFFDLVFKNFDQFKGLVGDMQNSGGALDDAFKKMFDTPANKSQLLKNRLQVLRQEIGDQLIPIKLKLVDVLSKLVKLWTDLPEPVKQVITYILLAVAAFMVLAGIVLVVGGSILVFAGVVALIGAPVLLVIAAIGLLIGAIIFLAVAVYENWGGLGDFAKGVWNDIVKYFNIAKNEVIRIWGEIEKSAEHVWNGIKNGINDTLGEAAKIFKQIWTDVSKWWDTNGQSMINDVENTFSHLVDAISAIWGPLVDAVTSVMNTILDIVQGVLWVVEQLWGMFGDNILKGVTIVWNLIVGIINAAIDIIQGIIEVVLGIINGDWNQIWTGIKDFTKGIWEAIWTTIQFMAAQIWNGILALWSIIKAIWQEGLGAVINFVVEWVGKIVTFFVELPDKIIGALWSLAGKLWDLMTGAMVSLGRAAGQEWSITLHWFEGLPGAIVGALGDIADKMWNLGKRVVEALKNGAVEAAKAVVGFFADLGGQIYDATLGHLFGSPKLFTYYVGQDLIKQMMEGVSSQLPGMQKAMAAVGPSALPLIGAPAGYGITNNNSNSAINVNVATNADPYQISREIVWAQITNPFPLPSEQTTARPQ
jgi:TP901 family phage tail tape measure protein